MSIPEPIRSILGEMRETLRDLKVQVGRELPHFAKLEGNITALEQPREHFESVANAPLPAPFTPEPTLVLGGDRIPEVVTNAPDAPSLSSLIVNDGVIPTSFPGAPFLSNVEIDTFLELRAELQSHSGTLTHIPGIDTTLSAAIVRALQAHDAK